MTDLDLSQDICVRTFGFNVPCRRFALAAKVTRDRRMPLVDEFVLRALKLTGELTITRLAGFFGFSTAEVQTVIADLASRSLVTMQGENVRLHPSALEMFRTSQDGPTVLEVESWVEILWFDLISGNMIAKGIRHGKNLVELQASGARVSVPADFARAAFEQNFRDYLKIFRKINNPDLYNLYAVTDVQPSQYGFVALAGREDLVLRPEPKLLPSLLETEGDPVQRLRKLNDAMRQAYEGLTHPEPSAAARGEYAKLTQSASLQDSMQGNGYVDVERWLQEERAVRSAGVETLIGAAYLERNRQSFRRLVEMKLTSQTEGSGPVPELVWVRSGGSAWGASDDLRAMLADVRAAARVARERHGPIRTTLVVPATERGSRPRRFNRLFDQGLLAPAGYLTPALEVILLRGTAAIVLVWVPLSDSCAIWVGRATTRAQDLSTLEVRLDWKQLQAQAERLWPNIGSRPVANRSEVI